MIRSNSSFTAGMSWAMHTPCPHDMIPMSTSPSSYIFFALSPAATAKLVEALRYEQLFYFYMGGTLVLGLYLTLAGFSA